MRLPISLFLILTPAAAMAHPHGHADAGGLVAGLTHPLLGPDHLLAMVAVGLWAAAIGGRAQWALPAAFLAAMAVAGLLGAGGVEVALVEHVIIASVIVLGAAVALALRFPLALSLVLVTAFGAAHGWAHGVEGPGGTAYAAGFVLATGALHAAGIALGRLWPQALRGAGAAVALGGGALALM